MLHFTKLHYKNFLSVGEDPIEVALDKCESTLIVGQNGKGKSTMADALTFALFGRAHRNIKNDQLINCINGKKLHVEVEFIVKSKKDQHVRIVRGFKPRKFEIYVDGTMLNQHSHAKEQQRYLEQSILKMNYKSFSQIVILGSNTFIPFMQLQKHIRKNVIEDILDIHVFSKMNDLAKIEQAQLNDSITEINDAMFAKDNLIERERDEIENLTEALQQNQEQIQQRIDSEVARVKQIMLTDKTLLASKQQALIEVEEEYRQLVSRSAQVSKTQLTEQRNMKSRFSAAGVKLHDNIRRLDKTTTFLLDNDACPTCEQDIDEMFRNTKISKNEKAKAEYLEAIDDIDKHVALFAEKIQIIEKDMAVLDSVQQQKAEIRREQTYLESTIKRFEQQIAELESEAKTENPESGGRIKKKIADKKLQIETLKNEITELKFDYKSLRKDQQYNQLMLEMLHDSGIRTRVINQYLPAINYFINQFLGALDLFVSFELDGEFNETIKARHLDNFSYESFSEGQKQRIDLALIFTWREIARMKNTVATNLLILDETLDASLDTAGIESLMKILQYSIGDHNNIFVISHKEELLESKFDSKLRFDMKHNFSFIERTKQNTTVF